MHGPPGGSRAAATGSPSLRSLGSPAFPHQQRWPPLTPRSPASSSPRRRHSHFPARDLRRPQRVLLRHPVVSVHRPRAHLARHHVRGEDLLQRRARVGVHPLARRRVQGDGGRPVAVTRLRARADGERQQQARGGAEAEEEEHRHHLQRADALDRGRGRWQQDLGLEHLQRDWRRQGRACTLARELRVDDEGDDRAREHNDAHSCSGATPCGRGGQGSPQHALRRGAARCGERRRCEPLGGGALVLFAWARTICTILRRLQGSLPGRLGSFGMRIPLPTGLHDDADSQEQEKGDSLGAHAALCE
mmetsp:Transcript_66836/g.206968  ORF Transcript_66836/g.206968 Transcript_66836/m.206968 type:complete len:304 (-) Transcript_66836:29-940(-)